jgi:DNA-binding NarL/FixJ family response regulator
MKIAIGIVDDHQLFLKSLGLLISSFEDFTIVIEALHGKDLIDKLETKKIIPDILLIDVNMPVMDGPATVKYLTEKYPAIKAVALSMKDDDATIIGMIKAGCCAYLLKDIHPTELEKALLEINSKGYYNADATNLSFRRVIQGKDKTVSLTEKEKEFLKLACSDLTYKQIAALLHLSERTVDGYRETLFQKLKVQSRVGMALEAIRLDLVSL